MMIAVIFYALGAASTAATAHMGLPAEFEAQPERIEIKGFGGRNKGEWQVVTPSGDRYSGRFTRSESRLGVFDPLYVRNKGKSSFTFVVDTGEALVSAECSFRKVTVNVNIVTIDADKLAYQCDLRGPSVQGAWIAVGQPKREGLKKKLLAQDLRRGEAQVFGVALAIESVHGYAGTRLTSQPPVGYLLRSGDHVVGAVELTDWNPAVYLAKDLAPQTVQSVFVAALAMAVLRDPANSALED